MKMLTRYKKNIFSNKTQLVLSIFFYMLLILGVGYGILVSDLSILGNIVVKEYDDPNLFNKIIRLKDNNSCITKYEGQVTDQVGQTVQASNVYFNKCADKRNIIFNNMCWQMIRTTETGGIKMIYNGEPDNNGECGSSRGDHKGIVQSYRDDEFLNSNYLYGDSFTYDTSTNEFTLIDTFMATWSDSTYEDLLGKFTCKNTSGTCTELYSIFLHINNNVAYTSSYTISDTNYAQIGTSSFNADSDSLAMIGYMFNKIYDYSHLSPTSGSLMGNDVSYSNGIYTLLPASGESELGTTLDDTHHYTCNNTTGMCNKVRYYYNDRGANKDHVELDGEDNIEEVVNNMLYDDNVNRYNSSIKGIIDAWYRQNLLNKTNMLEDTVFCNARDMSNQSTNGWNKNGGISTEIRFKNYNLTDDMTCLNITDQFSISNNKAKLIYPVALATRGELYNLTNNNNSTYYDTLTKTNSNWWGFSPIRFTTIYIGMNNVNSNGAVHYTNPIYSPLGIRLVVSLDSSTTISYGTGSETDPWIVDEDA